MTKQLNSVLKHFGDLDAWMNFLNEQINDGAEISRGKDPNDKSKEQKAEEAAPPEGDAGMDPAAAGGEAAPAPPIIDPSAAPGSQIAIGKKLEKTFDAKAQEIQISGKKQKLNMKPRANMISNGTF